MDEKQIRAKLIELKHQALERIESIDRNIRHEGMSADWSEQASERENDEVLESLGNSSEQDLEMIKFALKRIDDGVYFYCAECGDEIPEARLELLPFTAYCVDCAEKIET